MQVTLGLRSPVHVERGRATSCQGKAGSRMPQVTRCVAAVPAASLLLGRCAESAVGPWALRDPMWMTGPSAQFWRLQCPRSRCRRTHQLSIVEGLLPDSLPFSLGVLAWPKDPESSGAIHDLVNSQSSLYLLEQFAVHSKIEPQVQSSCVPQPHTASPVLTLPPPSATSPSGGVYVTVLDLHGHVVITQSPQFSFGLAPHGAHSTECV